MAYELCAFFGDQIRRFPLGAPGEYSIGRAEGSEIRIDHPSVSRRHALLTTGERLLVRDLGGANGTVIRDRQRQRRAGETENVRHLSNDEAELAVGDPIMLGVVTLVVRRTSEPATGGAASGPSGNVVLVAPAMRALYEQVARVAASNISVLVLGETGVGKEVLARAIHAASARARGPLLSVNCGALTESIIESELFGHEKGAFTGALQARAGLFESAENGTVFLDEVGELPATTQTKLLRVLEDRTVMRLGSRSARPVDVRFVAATNRDLEAAANAGRFRQDLYFRLNGIALSIPPLRERRVEIDALAKNFVTAACRDLDRPRPLALAERTVDLLREYAWPGNVRELRNVIDRAVVLCEDDVIQPDHLPPHLLRPRPEAPAETDTDRPVAPASEDPRDALNAQMRELEKKRIVEALALCGGNQTQAAKMLGISRRTLVTRLGEFELPRPRGPRKE